MTDTPSSSHIARPGGNKPGRVGVQPGQAASNPGKEHADSAAPQVCRSDEGLIPEDVLFRDRLEALHALSLELSKAGSIREFCRLVVVLGREKLGFDRLGLWFLVPGPEAMFRGSFGIDEHGAVRDEWNYTYPASANGFVSQMADGDRAVVMDEESPLYDGRLHVVGTGSVCIAPLWDGEQIIGYLASDNLLNHQPITSRQIDLLKLYAATVGHLYARKKVEQDLRDSQQAERTFRKRLQALHEVNSRLSMAGESNELLRQATTLAHEMLGFDRVGIWLTDPENPDVLKGTFGIDTQGRLRDERDRRYRGLDEGLFMRVVRGQLPFGARDYHIRAHDGGKDPETIRQVIAPLWDGQKVVGIVGMDNLIHRRPIEEQQIELLRLFAFDLGHIYTRILAEEALRKSERDYRMLIETQSDLVMKWSVDSRLLFVSPSLCQALGKSQEELVGKTINPEVHPEDIETTNEFIASIRKPPYSGYVEHRVRMKGAWHWMSWSVNGLLDTDGKLTAFVGVGRDVTERRKREELLQVSQFAIESTTNAITIADLDGRINTVNKAFLNLWGLNEADDAIGKPLESFLAEGQYSPEIVDALAASGSWSGQRAGQRADGTLFPTYMAANIIKDKSGKPFSLVACLIDMTERREMEREAFDAAMAERRRIGQDLHDSLGQVLTGVAFLSKSLEANLAKRSLPQAADARQIVKHIDESITLTRTLARGLQPVMLGPGGLTDALKTLACDMTALHKIHCTFEASEDIDIDDDSVATQLYHIAQEAASNVVRHAKASSIQIRLDRTAGGMVKLSVADDGRGMDIHHPVARTGIGMRTMRYRAGIIDGAFDISSTRGGGTVVSCVFGDRAWHRKETGQ